MSSTDRHHLEHSGHYSDITRELLDQQELLRSLGKEYLRGKHWGEEYSDIWMFIDEHSVKNLKEPAQVSNGRKLKFAIISENWKNFPNS